LHADNAGVAYPLIDEDFDKPVRPAQTANKRRVAKRELSICRFKFRKCDGHLVKCRLSLINSRILGIVLDPRKKFPGLPEMTIIMCI
jgi:hypothetical protein